MFRISQWEHENAAYYGQFGLPCHCGLDFPAVNGTPIKSVAQGTVSYVNLNPAASNYGIHVRIRHADNWYTLYAHLQSVNVVLNQVVSCGQTIGLSNNTGNSSGPHLHMEVRNTLYPYLDVDGNTWPYGMQPVWPFLKDFYNDWLNNRGTNGYLYAPGLIKNMEGNYARVSGTLNLRSQPSSSSTLLGQVITGSVVKILSQTPSNAYYFVKAPLDTVSIISNADYGLHLRADPDTPRQAEYDAVRQMLQKGGKTVKLLHNHPDNVYREIASYNPDYVIIRIMQHWGGRNITPQQFYDWNVIELQRKIALLPNADIIVEIHNEPNLRDEGWGYSWANGSEFAIWFNQVASLLKTTLGTRVKLAYPGLSPGGSIPNIRYSSDAFLTEGLVRGLNADVFCCHAYWSDQYPMSIALQDVQNFRNRVPNKELYVTEASRNDRPATKTPQQYGQEYATFVKSVNADAVYFFVGSASNPYFEPECWISESGQDKGITNSFIANI